MFVLSQRESLKHILPLWCKRLKAEQNTSPYVTTSQDRPMDVLTCFLFTKVLKEKTEVVKYRFKDQSLLMKHILLVHVHTAVCFFVCLQKDRDVSAPFSHVQR